MRLHCDCSVAEKSFSPLGMNTPEVILFWFPTSCHKSLMDYKALRVCLECSRCRWQPAWRNVGRFLHYIRSFVIAFTAWPSKKNKKNPVFFKVNTFCFPDEPKICYLSALKSNCFENCIEKWYDTFLKAFIFTSIRIMPLEMRWFVFKYVKLSRLFVKGNSILFYSFFPFFFSSLTKWGFSVGTCRTIRSAPTGFVIHYTDNCFSTPGNPRANPN